jgi:hypothetical protein
MKLKNLYNNFVCCFISKQRHNFQGNGYKTIELSEIKTPIRNFLFMEDKIENVLKGNFGGCQGFANMS